MHKGIYIIGLLLLLLASCTGDKEVRAFLQDTSGHSANSISYSPMRRIGNRDF